MEFKAVVSGVLYNFSVLGNRCVLVSGGNAEYILYKTKLWLCADDVNPDLVEMLGEVIDKQMEAVH